MGTIEQLSKDILNTEHEILKAIRKLEKDWPNFEFKINHIINLENGLDFVELKTTFK
jgi:hypothetical protein